MIRKGFESAERALAPPKNYANFTYYDRLWFLFKDVFSGKPVVTRLLQFSILLTMMVISFCATPLCLILSKSGWRFVDIDLDQIGSILFLDILLKEDILEKKKSKILVLASSSRDGNRYILDLYNNHVTFIRNPLLKFFLYPFFVSHVFKNDSSHRFEAVFPTEIVAHKIWKKYTEEIGTPLVAMSPNDKYEARRILEKHLPQGRPFVSIHVRDTGFYKNEKQNTRNGDIFTYLPAIKYLIKKGFNVVRIGDPFMKDIEPMLVECGPYLFDYACSEIKSQLIDCYLMSECVFFIGCASGPNCIPPIFNVNCVTVNWYNASNALFYSKGDIATFKKFRWCENGRLVPLSNLMKPPYSVNPTIVELAQEGVELSDNTPEEIYETVREFVENDTQEVTPLQKRGRSLLRPENYSVGAQGNFSNTIMEVYLRDGALG